MDAQGNQIIPSEEKGDRVIEPANLEEVILVEGKKKKNILTKLFGSSKSKTEKEKEKEKEYKEYEVGLVEEDDPDFHANANITEAAA